MKEDSLKDGIQRGLALKSSLHQQMGFPAERPNSSGPSG